ncbi:MAG: YkgJ family cysteine cluster protein [Cyclobacteriaceae bacterium]
MKYQSDLESALRAHERLKKILVQAKKKPKGLDDRFHELHDEVFEEVDCLDCANCCKTTSPIFIMSDIERLSKHLKMKPKLFIEAYLRKDEDGDWVLKQSPCTFLMDDNKCLVYEARPRACREYPHTNRKRMHQITSLTLKNTQVCPAVFRIVSRLEG